MLLVHLKSLKEWDCDFLCAFGIYLRFKRILLLNGSSFFDFRCFLFVFIDLVVLLSLVSYYTFVINNSLAYFIYFGLKSALSHLLKQFLRRRWLFLFWHWICP